MTMNLTGAIAAAIDPGTIMRAAGLEPDSWQCQALLCEDPRILINVCRQGGKSSVGAALAVHQAVFRKQRSLTLMVAPVLRQTSELFTKCRQLYNAIGRPIPLKSESALKLELQNGSRIICVPADQETVQGYSADLVIFDEGARIPDPVFFALRPSVAATGGRIIGMSTPAGQQGWFAKAWLEEDYWKKFTITADQCPRISKEFLDQERTTLGDYLYEQEYFGRFHSGSAIPGFIEGGAVRECLELNYRFRPCPHCGVVDACEHEPTPNKAWQSAPIDIGLDVARSPDGDSVVFAFVKGRMLVHLIVYPGQPITQTTGKAIKFINEIGARSIRIDDGAMGGGVVDQLYEAQERHDAHHHLRNCEIVPINFGAKAFDPERFFNMRTEMWWHMGQQIQAREVGLINDERLISEITAPAMQQASDGRLKLESKDSLRGRGIRSPDIGDALAMALYPDGWFPQATAW